jgi:flagellar hook-associated protein 2
VTLNDDGTLTFDQTAFTTAMQADPTGVTNMFASASGGSGGIMNAINSSISSLTDPTSGSITAELNAFSSRNTELGSQISTLQLQVTNYQAQLAAEFTAMNKQLEQYKNESSALTQAFNTSTSSTSSSVL